MTTCFALVGQHRDDPDCLLLRGDDGRFYGYHLPDGVVTPVKAGAREWDLDAGLLAADAWSAATVAADPPPDQSGVAPPGA